MHPANLCFKLPENVSLEEGAMCEPLSVGLHACRRADVSPHSQVVIMGAGPIGLVTMLAARAFGVPKIVMVDVDDRRLSFAKDHGADEIIQVSNNIRVRFIKILICIKQDINFNTECHFQQFSKRLYIIDSI